MVLEQMPEQYVGVGECLIHLRYPSKRQPLPRPPLRTLASSLPEWGESCIFRECAGRAPDDLLLVCHDDLAVVVLDDKDVALPEIEFIADFDQNCDLPFAGDLGR